MWSAWWGAGQDLQWEGERSEPNLGARCCFLSLSCLMVPEASISGCFLSASPYAGSRGTRETETEVKYHLSGRKHMNVELEYVDSLFCGAGSPLMAPSGSSLLMLALRGLLKQMDVSCCSMKSMESGKSGFKSWCLYCIAVWPWVIDFICLDYIFVLSKTRVIKSTFEE